jgi:predicted metal-dependent phosphoesterase TrpH
MMSQSFVDLHCHSTASDGTLSPTEVVQLAHRAGLSALALTDHDTIAGVGEAASAAGSLGIDFLPGIEISCEFPHPGTMHLLGYGVDPESKVLRDLTRQLIDARDNRNPKIIAKLNDLGVAITMEEVEAEAGGGGVVGRPHIAAVLHRKGYVSSIKQAFDKYLGTTGAAYFDKERLSPRRAFELVRESGGLPVLAHPVQLRTTNDAELQRIVKDLVDLGLAGIEVIHSDHDDALVAKYTALADRYGLLKTGGSDFHGSNKKDIDLGLARGRRIPRAFFDALVARHLETRETRAAV